MRLGRCIECKESVKVLYIRERGKFKPFKLYCSCGISDEKIVLSYESGYRDQLDWKIKIENGRIIKLPPPT